MTELRALDGGLTGTNKGFIRFIPNDEIPEDERLSIDEVQADPFITSLAGHVRTCWESARENKDQDITDRLLKCLRLRKGEYTASERAAIESIHGDGNLFDQLTNVKCRAAESWLNDILMPPGERPWGILSTPNPELAPQKMDQLAAELKAEYEHMGMVMSQTVDQTNPIAVREMNSRIEKELSKFRDEFLKDVREQADRELDTLEEDIDDGLVEGGWYTVLKDVISDIVTFPTGFIKGPIIRQKKCLEWSPEGHPVVQTKLLREFDRVSPFDIFPSPTAKTLQDSYLIQKHRFERKDLNDLIGVEGYDDDAIRKVLREHGDGGLREWLNEDDERAELEDRPNDDNASGIDTIDCLEFWGSVQGSKLLEWGMGEEEIPDAERDYDVNCFLIGSTVICARLNADPLGRRPYFGASFTKVTDSIWGIGVPELLEPKQKVCNGCLQALVRNMSMASGPMTWLDMSRIDPSNNPDEIYPLKIWQFNGDPGNSGLPVGFFQPDPIIDVLLKLYDYFYKQAGEDPGIPNYMYGANEQGGAARTASGLSMLMNAAAKVLKTVATNVDEGIIKPSITAYWTHIMLNEPDKATGDIKIVPKASEYLVMMEQLQIRRQEFLQATANDYDFQIMGLKGRAEVLRETLRSLKMRSDKIVPDNNSFDKSVSEQELMMFMQNLSRELKIPPEQLMMMAQGNAPGSQPGPQNLDAAGAPVAGQELARL